MGFFSVFRRVIINIECNFLDFKDFETKLKDSVNDISKVAATAILSLVNIIKNMRASNISARDSLAIGNYAAQ